MPGFAGIVSLNGTPIAEGRLRQFIRKHPGNQPIILERLPENSPNIFFTPITEDLSFPVNPFSKAANKETALYFLGDIFNEEFNQNSVADALLEAYRTEGINFFIRLNGSFIAIIYHFETNTLQILNNRSAAIPIYVLQTDDLFAFSCRMQPLIDLFSATPKVNAAAVSNFLTNGYCLSGRTLIDGIRALPPANLITINRDGVKLRPYWQYTFKPFREQISEPEAIAEFGQLIFDATRRRISDDDGFGVLLSGGYDSRAILGSVLGQYPDQPLNTITWGETAGKPGSDSQIARQIAANIKSQHTFYHIDPAGLMAHFRTFVKRDEGRTDGIGNYPEGLHIFEQIRDDLGIKYLLRGDEVFGWKESIADVAEMLHSMDIHNLEGLPRNYQYINGPVYERLNSASQSVLVGILNDIPYDDLHDVKDHIYFHQRLGNYLNPLSHLKEQVIWMRNPFLDNDVLEYITKLPTEYRLGKKLFIATVTAMFPELNRFPIASVNNLINWTKRFQSDKALQQFAYKILFEDLNQFDELLHRSRLTNFFQKATQTPANDSFGNLSASQIKDRVQNKITRTLGFYHISPSQEIFRLMILKIFADEFLGGSFELR